MRNHRANFAVTGSIMSIVFLLIVNIITSPDYLWFVHPAFALIQWPIAMYFAATGRIKLYSLVSTLLLIIYLIWENIIQGAGHPWFLYPALAVIWWPILMYAGRYAATLGMAIISSILIIGSYGALNLLFSPEYPWIIFVAYTILWWPMSIYFTRSRRWFDFSLCASLLTSALFIIVNAISSPDEIWAIYPIFAVIWWPLSMHYYAKHPQV
ncbi:hypothetical protein [Paenibacillus sp. OV219]|uniref:hypothetical protein n=1 Tax=Paenibacillus sp. OV219 TaxID=1884377 RepID=UPI0008BEC6B5|nr:hypothetical protein [Paenibacillus sp. OV219]SEM78858.1 hypothetical protein SAMN05518847_101797 [Paenibacillus sp. OV219]